MKTLKKTVEDHKHLIKYLKVIKLKEAIKALDTLLETKIINKSSYNLILKQIDGTNGTVGN